MPDLNLDELAAIEGRMTDGPWHARPDGYIHQTAHVTRDVWTIPHVDEDIPGIVALRNAASALLARARDAERYERELASIKSDVVEHIHDGGEFNWVEAIIAVRAWREELAKLKGYNDAAT